MRTWHSFRASRHCLILLSLSYLLSVRGAPALELTLSKNNSPSLSIPPIPNRSSAYEVQTSTNLTDWKSLGTFLHHLEPYEDRSPRERARFYRAVEHPSPPETNAWANQFHSQAPLRKFLFLTNNPDQVFFHDETRFHHEFVSSHFPEFRSLSGAELDEIALFPSRQKIVLGGLINPVHRVLPIKGLSGSNSLALNLSLPKS